MIPEQSGGVGIADIQHLLNPKDRVREAEFQAFMEESRKIEKVEGSSEDSAKTRTIEVTITPGRESLTLYPALYFCLSRLAARSPFLDITYNRYTVDMRRASAIGRSFIGWGGFYQSPVSANADGAIPSPSEMLALCILK